MKGIYKISIYIIIPPPLSFLDLDPNTALRRQADLWGLGSKMLEMRGRYDVAYYSPYLSFLWYKQTVCRLRKTCVRFWRILNMAKMSGAGDLMDELTEQMTGVLWRVQVGRSTTRKLVRTREKLLAQALSLQTALEEGLQQNRVGHWVVRTIQ